MPQRKHDLASEPSGAAEQEKELMSRLPASFRVLAEFALKEKDGGINE